MDDRCAKLAKFWTMLSGLAMGQFWQNLVFFEVCLRGSKLSQNRRRNCNREETKEIQ